MTRVAAQSSQRLTFSFDVSCVAMQNVGKVDQIGAPGHANEQQDKYIHVGGPKKHFHSFVDAKRPTRECNSFRLI